MPKLISIKHKRLVKILEKLGFIRRDAEGSHVFFQTPRWENNNGFDSQQRTIKRPIKKNFE